MQFEALVYTSKPINVFQNKVLFEQKEIMNNLILLQTEAKAILKVFWQAGYHKSNQIKLSKY